MQIKKRIDHFEDLIAWQKARILVSDIYRVTRLDRFRTDFALRNQIRKAAISIPSNIAEGFERSRRAEFHHFDEKTRDARLKKAEEVGRIIGGLRASLGRPTQHSALSIQHSE